MSISLNYLSVKYLISNKNSPGASVILFGFQYSDGGVLSKTSITEAGEYKATFSSSRGIRIYKFAKKGGFVQTSTPVHSTNLRLFENKQKAQEYLDIKCNELKGLISVAQKMSEENLEYLQNIKLP